MRIAVLGAGAIGGAIAALLDRGGHDVRVTARGEQLDAIRARGLRLEGAWGEHLARPAAAERISSPIELAVLATKAHDAEDALSANAALLRGIPVVVVQNGLAGVETARSLLPRSDVVGGIAVFAASLREPGVVVVTAAGTLFLARGDARHDVPARYAASVLGTVLPVELVSDFRGAQWSKLVLNQVNALPAITGLSVQETVADAGLRRLLVLSMRESVRVARALGVRFAPLQGLGDGILRVFTAAPLPLAELLPRAMARRMGDVPNPGSTLQSIRRGRTTEIDALHGAVVDAARRAGGEAPVNAFLVELVHEVERTRSFLAPREVLERARAADLLP